MSHTPYGYRIENGTARIEENEAAVIRSLFENYLSGMALQNAAAEAGLTTYHGTAKRILQNRHYLGDDFYPPIVDRATFDAAEEEIRERAEALGRLNRATAAPAASVPTEFIMRRPEKEFANPFEHAEYLYGLIERRVNSYGTE